MPSRKLILLFTCTLAPLLGKPAPSRRFPLGLRSNVWTADEEGAVDELDRLNSTGGSHLGRSYGLRYRNLA